MSVVDDLLALAVAVLLLTSGTHKLFDMKAFRRVLERYDRFPSGVRRGALILVPTLELGSGAWLISGAEPRLAALVAGSLLLALFGAVIVQRPKQGCGCLPVAEKSPLPVHAAFSAIVAATCFSLAAIDSAPRPDEFVLAAAAAASIGTLGGAAVAHGQSLSLKFSAARARSLSWMHSRRREWEPETTVTIPSPGHWEVHE